MKPKLLAATLILAFATGFAWAAPPSADAELRALAGKEAAQGDARAKAYLDLWDLKADAKAADLGSRWLGVKAREGVPAAQYMLARLLEAQEPPDHEHALQLHEKAARQGYAPAMYQLALMYEKGTGVPVETRKAFDWAMKGAQANDPDCQFFVGRMYASGKAVPKDVPKAVEWLEKSATQGEQVAALMLVALYSTGEGIPRDDVRARYWLDRFGSKDSAPKAAVSDQEKAARALALQKDPDAGRLFDAAENGGVREQSQIGFLFLKGERFPRDFDHAAYYLSKAAEAGDSRAQVNLGSMYATGEKFPKDEARALQLYRRAAAKGNAQAQANIGSYYYRGLGGLKPDAAEAARWYKLAADQHHASAERSLAIMYERGLGGLPVDKAQADALYKRAAEHGDRNAQQRLDAMKARR